MGTSTNRSAISCTIGTRGLQRRDEDEIFGELSAHLHQLVLHLRHRNIEDLDHGPHVGDVLHGAQLDPFLWSLRLGQAGRPHSPLGVFLVKQLEERPERRRASVAVARCTCPRAPPLPPWPPSGAVRCGAPPHPGAVACSRRLPASHHHLKGHHKERARLGQTAVVVVVSECVFDVCISTT